jgi:hypothetical protein
MPNGCEIAQVAQQYQRQAEMEHRTEHPDPQVGLEQAFEQHDFARHAEHHAAGSRWRRGGGDLERRGCARVIGDTVGETAYEQGRSKIKQNRKQGAHASKVVP